MALPPANFVYSTPPSNLQTTALSQAQFYTGMAKIENLTYRVGYLSSFLSAAQEILTSSLLFPSQFYYFQKEILTLIETARKTLRGAKVVPYLWASCPESMVPHKAAYIEILRILQVNEPYIDTEFHGRMRTLFMPLTSHFSIQVPRGGDFQAVGHRFTKSLPPSPLHPGNEWKYPNMRSAPHAAPSRNMLPPSAFPQQTNDWPQIHETIPRPHGRERRLWSPEELASPIPGSRKHRNRGSDKRSAQTKDEKFDQENVAPEQQPTPFRQPRSALRFGICFSSKSSGFGGGYQQKERSLDGRSARSLINPKE